MGDEPIQSVIQPVITETMLNSNGLKFDTCEQILTHVLHLGIPQIHKVSDSRVRRLGTHHREVHGASLGVRLPHGAGEPAARDAEERQGRRAPDRNRQRHQTTVRTRIRAGTEEVSISVY